MRRVPPFGRLLIGAVLATVALNLVAPGVGLVAAIGLALVILAVAAEGMGVNAGFFDVHAASDRKREALARRYRRGRPDWLWRAPDHADEPPELIWERERRRRGLR